MQTQTLNDYTYMVLSHNDKLNQDVGEVLDNVFGLRKVQKSLTDKKLPSNEHVDIALIDREHYNFEELTGWSNDKDYHTKLVLIVDELSRSQVIDSEKGIFTFVSRSTLHNQLLTTVSRLIVDIELERLRLQHSEINNKEVFIKGDSTFYRLVLNDVDYIEAYGNYIKIHYSNGKWSIGNCSISTIESKLRSDKFCRIHRSYMVRLDRVDNFNSLNLEINKNILPIGFNPFFPVATSCTGCNGTQRFFGRVRRGPYNTPPRSGGRVTDDVVRGMWEIRLASGTTPVTLGIRLGWNGSEEDNTLGNDVGISIYDTNLPLASRFWNVSNNIGPKTGSNPYFKERDITFTGNGRIYFAVTNDISPLPVTLISFTGFLNPERAVELNWQTASETDNDHFTIQRSVDSSHTFQDIGFVAGNGNSDALINYHYIDESVSSKTGFVHYRLKQVDFSGAFEYSPIVAVAVRHFTDNNKQGWKFFPNPTNGHDFELVLIDPNISLKEEYLFEIVDTSGEILRTGRKGIENASNWVSSQLNGLPNGIYILVITTSSRTDRMRIIKK